MFALAEIVENKLYALVQANGIDTFHQCFNDWQDVTYLYNFFKNPQLLRYYGVDRKTAVGLVLKEGQQFFGDILDIAQGNADATALDNIIFEPLHGGDDFDLPIIETKSYGNARGKSFLRLYAVRLSDGCYIVVGGIIKTTEALQDSEDGKAILKTLKMLKQFLIKNHYEDTFDIGVLVI